MDPDDQIEFRVKFARETYEKANTEPDKSFQMRWSVQI
jgi:hypothetical protein